jgi:hypothetical protein
MFWSFRQISLSKIFAFRKKNAFIRRKQSRNWLTLSNRLINILRTSFDAGKTNLHVHVKIVKWILLWFAQVFTVVGLVRSHDTLTLAKKRAREKKTINTFFHSILELF